MVGIYDRKYAIDNTKTVIWLPKLFMKNKGDYLKDFEKKCKKIDKLFYQSF